MRGDHGIAERIRSHAPSELALSAVTLAEILYGIARSPSRKRERSHRIQQIASLLHVHAFDEDAARQYAIVRSELESSGVAIRERDTQIAAVALAHRLTLVTHNVKEFCRVERLKVEDWAEGGR